MKLYCRNPQCGGERKTKAFQPEPGEHICPSCGGWMGTFKPRESCQKAPKAATLGRRKRSGFTPASDSQRAKVREEPCVVTGESAIEGAVIDPAHLCPRAAGGCGDPLCTVSLRRDVHSAFDDGTFDLLPYLRPHHNPRAYLPELLHALDHYDGDILGLLRRLTGDRYVPEHVKEDAA